MYKAYFLPGKFEKGAPHFLPLPGGGGMLAPFTHNISIISKLAQQHEEYMIIRGKTEHRFESVTRGETEHKLESNLRWNRTDYEAGGNTKRNRTRAELNKGRINKGRIEQGQN